MSFAHSELKNALRAGDVSVPGSRQFRDFDAYLIDREAFAGQAAAARTGLSLDVDSHEFLKSRMTQLKRELDLTARLAQAGELPDSELTERGLEIKPLDDSVPPAAEGLIRQIAGLIPHVKITDLLLEVLAACTGTDGRRGKRLMICQEH